MNPVAIVLLVVFAVLAIHFYADFIYQTPQMAAGKSSKLKWLLIHATTYTAIFTISIVIWVGLPVWYGLVNGGTHLLIDGVTSKITSRLWHKGEIHLFFVTVGFDQLLHGAVMLACLYPVLGKLLVF